MRLLYLVGGDRLGARYLLAGLETVLALTTLLLFVALARR
jgi:hypothetical protein